MTSRKLLVVLTSILALSCNAIAARPDFYVRPVAQYTWLPAGSRKSVTLYEGWVNGNLGPAYSASQFTASSGGFGGGLSAGIIWGKNNSFEFGGEGTITRFSGSYVINQTAPVNTGSATHSCTFTVKSVLASFRHFFGAKDAKFRPYYGVVLGETTMDISKPVPPPSNGTYTHIYDERSDLSAGLGAGVVYTLGQGTQIELGYRVMGSWRESVTGESGKFYAESHTLSCAWRANF